MVVPVPSAGIPSAGPPELPGARELADASTTAAMIVVVLDDLNEKQQQEVEARDV